jgi:hypothetical protein
LFDEAGAPKPAAPPADWVRYGERWSVGWFLHGRVLSEGGAWNLELDVRSARNGKTVGRAVLSAGWLPGLLQRIDSEFVTAAQPLLSSDAGDSASIEARPLHGQEQASTSNNQRVVDTTAVPVARSRSSGTARSALVLSAGGSLVFREMSSRSGQNPFGELHGQRGTLPVVNVGARFFPGALVSNGFWSQLGVAAEFERSVAGSARFSGENGEVAVATSLLGYSAGPHARIPFHGNHGELGLSILFGRQRLALDFGSAGAPSSGEPLPSAPPRSLSASGVGGVPDVDYTYWRFGLDGGYRFMPWLGVNAAVGYRLVTDAGGDAGEIASGSVAAGEPAFFPSDHVNAVDGGLSVDFHVTRSFAVRIGASAGVYAHDFNVSSSSLITDEGQRRPNAGGALDRYIRGGLGVVWEPGRPALSAPGAKPSG